MARIAGVDLPRDKRVEYALPYIYGIGLTLSREILEKTGINPDTRVRDLTEAEIAKLRELLDHEYKVEGDLRREESLNIKRLVEIVASVTEKVCLFVVRTPRTTPVLAKAPRTLAARRNNRKEGSDEWLVRKLSVTNGK